MGIIPSIIASGWSGTGTPVADPISTPPRLFSTVRSKRRILRPWRARVNVAAMTGEVGINLRIISSGIVSSTS